jgi:hypothetical protein
LSVELIFYLAKHHYSVLQTHQLSNFEQLWNTPVDWFEPPNQRRGGWSGVGKLTLQDASGHTRSYFIKKQENHGRRTWQHPLVGEPTFRREYARLRFLETKQFAAPVVVFYGESQQGKQQRAILMTEALEDFTPMDSFLQDQYIRMQRLEKVSFLSTVAAEVRRFHDLGLVHRALYPKHLFIHVRRQPVQVAVIDLEKARATPWMWYRSYFDLAALNRHIDKLSNTERLRFYKHYMKMDRLSVFARWLSRAIIKRSQR